MGVIGKIRGVGDRMKELERLKETLDEFADWNVTVTVSRKDLEKLISEYERLKEQVENSPVL